MAQAKVEATKLGAYALEDILDAKVRNTEGHPKFDGVQAINWSLTGKPSSEWQYRYQLEYKPKMYKAAACVLLLLSCFSFVGVVCSMDSIDARRSIYFMAVEAESATQGGIVFFILFTLGYTVYVTMWSLFQLKLAGLMDLVPGRTTPESLSFNVRMVSRLAAPLVFFYLGWIAENGINSGDWVNNSAPDILVDGVMVSQSIPMPSAFSNFYKLQDVKIIRQTFGTIFPIVLISFTFLTLSNTYNWLMVKIGFTGLQFGTPVVTDEQLREGIRQLNRTKKATINAARRSRFKSFLLRLVHGDTNDDHTDEHGQEDIDKPDTGFWASLCGQKQHYVDQALSQNSPMNSPIKATIPKQEYQTPDGCCGMVQLKEGSMMTKWVDLFVEVRPPGLLYFFVNKTDADNDKLCKNIDYPVDLVHILDFKIIGMTQLALYLPNITHTIRLNDAAEASLWMKSLIKWKDFNMDHGIDYMKTLKAEGAYALDSLNVNMDLGDLYTGNDDSTQKQTKTASEYIPPMSTAISESSATSDANRVRAPSGQSYTLGASDSGDDEKPKKLDGYLEMKSKTHSLMGGDTWDRRFVMVEESTRKVIIKKSANPSETPLFSFDLPAVVNIDYYNHKGIDHKRFNITFDQTEKDHKFRVQSELDGKRWVEGLNEWKDWFLMNYI